MKKQTEHFLILLGVIISQPLLAVALMTLWNWQNLAIFLDYYHALLLVLIGSGVVLLAEFIVMIYQWLYVDEIFDFHRKNENDRTKQHNSTRRDNLS